MLAVKQDGLSLKYASDAFRSDREIVLMAVSQHGEALQHAAMQLKHDRELVMVAVSQHGWTLRNASQDLQSDREIVLAAVSNSSGWALRFAGDDLLEDESFAKDAREKFYLFKVTTMSGRSCIVAFGGGTDAVGSVLVMACERL
eukprot:720775-Amphidinium_carterae.1